MQGFMATTLSRAQRWAELFSRLSTVLESLDGRQRCGLGRALGFLLQRALSTWEEDEAADLDPGSGLKRDLAAAARLSLPGHGAREPSADELWVLLELSDAYREDPDPGAYEDAERPAAELAKEFHALDQLSTGERCTLLPPSMRRRLDRIGDEAGRRGDPLHRLGLELSAFRVVRALYATAVGLRLTRRERRDGGEGIRLAWTLGESYLKSPDSAGHKASKGGLASVGVQG